MKKVHGTLLEDELEDSNSNNILTTQKKILNFCKNSVLDEKNYRSLERDTHKVLKKMVKQHGSFIFT